MIRMEMTEQEIKKQSYTIKELYNFLDLNQRLFKDVDIIDCLTEEEKYVWNSRWLNVPRRILYKIIENTDQEKLKYICDSRSLSHVYWYIITTKLHERIIMYLFELTGECTVKKIGTDSVLDNMATADARPDFLVINKHTKQEHKIEIQRCQYVVKNNGENKRFELKYSKYKAAQKTDNYLTFNYFIKKGYLYFMFLDPKKINKSNADYVKTLPVSHKGGYLLKNTDIISKFNDIDCFGYMHLEDIIKYRQIL